MTIDHHFLFSLPPDYDPQNAPLLGFDPSVYSRFKHGCRESIDFYGTALSRVLGGLMSDTSRVCIASSAYLNVPTSITLLLDHTLSLRKRCCKRIKLTRSHIIAPDYATLKHEERQRVMKDLTIHYDQENVRGNTLIVVDDSRVTGEHESSIVKHTAGICSKLIFVYIVDMGGCVLSDIEMQMNNYKVKSLEHIGDIMRHSEYEISSRVLKRIFSSSFSEFSSFFSVMPLYHKVRLYKLAISEGYNEMGNVEFIEKLNYLKTYYGAIRRQA